jgi:kynurenine formamidase
MRRAIDVSQVITSATPAGSTLPPDVRPSHSEPFSAVRRREDIMFLLRLENAHLGDDEVLDRFQYVTATADPAGTHVETYYPVKWFYEGEGAHTARDVADIPTRTLVNEAAVVDVPDLDRPMGPGDLKHAAKHVKPGDNVIFRSGLNRHWEDPGINPGGLESAYDQRTGLTLPATQWLTEQKVRACAIDFRTPEDPEYKWELPSHKQLHVNDVLIIEDIAHLDRLSSERLLMVTGAPIKGRHLTGGPARIVGIEGWGPLHEGC